MAPILCETCVGRPHSIRKLPSFALSGIEMGHLVFIPFMAFSLPVIRGVSCFIEHLSVLRYRDSLLS
jgi:hypothetical protein